MAFLNELNAKKKKKNVQKPEVNYQDCEETYVYNAIQTTPFNTHYLLVDVRSKAQYDAAHLYRAIHLDIDAVEDMSQVKNLSQIACNEPGNLRFIETKRVILYTQRETVKTAQYQKLQGVVNIFKSEANVSNCRMLKTGFQSFSERYPFLVIAAAPTTSPATRKPRLPTYPNEIIENALFLGDGQQATKEQIVSDLKITHIANISQEIKCAFPGKIQYIDVKIQDLEEEDISAHFDKVIAFIDQALKRSKDDNDGDDTNEQKESDSNRVLIHCEYGISRSSSMVIAYLMVGRKWDFETAKKYVHERRNKISPNDGFVAQLKELEKKILSN